MSRARLPLNPSAVQAADDAFYAAHPELVQNGRRTPLDGNDPNQAQLRSEWLRLYQANGGQLEEGPRGRDVTTPVEPCPPRDRRAVTVLIVTVVDRETGEPIEGARVTLQFQLAGIDQGPPIPEFETFSPATDRAGQARFEGIMPGQYVVWASAEGYGPEAVQAAAVQDQTTYATVPIAPYLLVIAYGWTGQEVTRGFEFAARTKERELRTRGQGEVFVAGLRSTKASFTNLLREIQARNQQVQEFHYYSHSGMEDGPIFQGGVQYAEAELRATQRLRWTPGAAAWFYGCTSAFGWFAPGFATHQNVPVFASVGYTSFSRRADAFDPIPEFAMTGPPVYQGVFLARTEAHRRIADYDASWLVRLAAGLVIAPIMFMNYAMAPGLPPMSMVRIPPGSRPVRAEDYFGRGEEAPVFSP